MIFFFLKKSGILFIFEFKIGQLNDQSKELHKTQ